MIRIRTERGQALVEFALVVPVFFAVLFAIVDLGFFAFTNSVMSQAAREGARTASVQVAWVGSTDPACGRLGGPECPGDASTLAANVAAAVQGASAGLTSDPTVHVRCTPNGSALPTGAWTTLPGSCTTAGPGDFVSVRIVYSFRPLTPVGLVLFGSSSDQTGSATMVIS